LLFHVTGPKGAGKSCLLRRLWSIVSPGEVPRVMFTLNPTVDVDYASWLLSDVRTNRSNLDEAIRLIAANIEGQSARLEEAGRPLPAEARLTLWSDMVEQILMEEPRNNRGLQIIVALPDLFSLPAPQIHLLARQMPRRTANVDCRIIITSNLKAAGEDLNMLFPERMPPEEVPLPALTIDEVETWTRVRQLPYDFVPEIYQLCGGLPGRLEKAASDVLQERQDRSLLQMAEHALEGLNEVQIQNVCMAAMLPEINAYTLLVLMPEEQVDATLLALRKNDWPDSAWKDRSLIAGEQIRAALVKFLERNFPKIYRKALPAAEKFAKIHRAIPSAEHREILARLSAFNYFNDALIREVMGPLADDVHRLASSNPGYFENTGSNMRLKQEVKQAVSAYIEIVQIEIPEAEKRKISAAWEKKRLGILDSMVRSEEKIKKESDALGAIQGQIKRLSGEIESEADNLNRMRRKSQRQKAVPVKNPGSKNPIWQILMQAIGFVILYIGILLSSRTSLLYAAVGIGFICGGLFIKGGMLAAPAASPDMPDKPSEEFDKHERNLHFLHLKRGQLESRQNLAALSIARERSALKEFDKQLREPYS
jgi:hypothetical protein